MKQTLCWICENACGKCSWSKDFTPVDGWKAKPTEIASYTTSKKGIRRKVSYSSYHVTECPEFKLLDDVKNNKKEREKWLDLIARNMSKNDTNSF